MEHTQILIKGGSGLLSSRRRFANTTVNYDYIHTDDTYGFYMSDKKGIIENKETFIKKAEDKMNTLKLRDEPHVMFIKEQEPGILKTRRCFAGLTNNSDVLKTLHVVWFDDGDVAVEESLYALLREIDWSKGQEFEY